jgi:streptomycin 6-kinase
MLKVTDDLDEQAGNALMAWWEGNGAAQVIADVSWGNGLFANE